MKKGLDPSDGVHDQVTELQRRTTELTDDVRRLSHRLHPATMEHVGLVAALKSYCAQFSSNAGIPIQMNLPDDLQPVSPDVALCLYRVTQESLQNISKHSGAREACVTLPEADGDLRLRVSDTGVGFDVQGENGQKGPRVSQYGRAGASSGRYLALDVSPRNGDRARGESASAPGGGARVTRPRVLLADDHAIVTEGLKRASWTRSSSSLGTVEDGRAMLLAAEELQPDVIVADITMPSLNGLDAVRQLKKKNARAKVVFLTMHSDADLATEAFRAGASGYLLKQSAGEELITAIHTVLKGRVYLTPLSFSRRYWKPS